MRAPKRPRARCRRRRGAGARLGPKGGHHQRQVGSDAQPRPGPSWDALKTRSSGAGTVTASKRALPCLALPRPPRSQPTSPDAVLGSSGKNGAGGVAFTARPLTLLAQSRRQIHAPAADPQSQVAPNRRLLLPRGTRAHRIYPAPDGDGCKPGVRPAQESPGAR